MTKFLFELFLALGIVGMAILCFTGCVGNIPQNLAIQQDVANDAGAPMLHSSNGLMSAGSGTHESSSAQKAKAFWGN